MTILFQVLHTPSKLTDRTKVIYAREIVLDGNVRFPFDELVKTFSILYPDKSYSFTFNIYKL